MSKRDIEIFAQRCASGSFGAVRFRAGDAAWFRERLALGLVKKVYLREADVAPSSVDHKSAVEQRRREMARLKAGPAATPDRTETRAEGIARRRREIEKIRATVK